MISYLGNFAEDATVYIMFNTFTSNDPSASCTITNFINTDVHIHKDDGLGQRNNAAGITVSVDFDGITGSHMVKIDTSDNTVAGFWVVGHEYFVRIEGTTIDGATINSVIGQFSIENRFNEVDVVKWLGQACAAVTVNGVPEVDMTHMAGGTQTVTDLKDFADSGYTPGTHSILLVDTVTTLTGHTVQTGDNFARIGAAGASLSDLGGMSTGMKSEINDQVVDVLKTDTISQIAQGAMPATPTFEQAVMYLYMMLRNKTTTDKDALLISLFDDAGTTVLSKSSVDDDGTTFTKGEFVTGA